MSHPGAIVVPMGGEPRSDGDRWPAVRFVAVARRLGSAARSAGLTVPAFRSPPTVPGAVRTLRHFRDGAVIAVALRDRSFDDVIVDMVEGVVRVNRLDPERADDARRDLLGALGDEPGAGLPSPRARMAERQTQAA